MIEKNPSQIGLETELKCQYFLINKGFDILIPLGNYLKYDLVIVKNNNFYRIQIKHAHQKCENSFSINTKYDKRENGKAQIRTAARHTVTENRRDIPNAKMEAEMQRILFAEKIKRGQIKPFR